LDHDLGHIDLINWQGRKSRRLKSRFTIWNAIGWASLLVGFIAFACQQMGWLHLAPPTSALPVLILGIGLVGLVVRIVRLTATWLIG
jgi:hypothetical protein